MLPERSKGGKRGMKHPRKRTIFIAMVVVMVSVFCSITAKAEEESSAKTYAAAEETARKDGWQFGANLYLWGASVGGKTASGDDIDVSFSDLLDDLEFGFMGGVGARNGRWSLMTDAMYMKLKQENNGQVTAFVGPRGNEIKIDVDATVKLRVWVVTAAVGYSIVDTDRVRLDVIAGARYLWVKPGLDLDISGPLQPRDKNISDSADILDGIVGIKGNVNLDKKWYVPYYADIGTGDSAFTWQGLAGVGYKISKVVDVVAAYRYLYWKFEDNKVLDKLDFSGPLVGMIFRF
jgi:opacity protein-like surface antigen